MYAPCEPCAGSLVEYHMAVVNTGNLKLKNLTVDVPDRIKDAGNCSIAFGNSGATLDVGEQFWCHSSVNVTTADIEKGNATYTVGVSATSALKADISVTREVLITPAQLPQLTLTALTCESAPSMPGMVQRKHRAVLTTVANTACCKEPSCYTPTYSCCPSYTLCCCKLQERGRGAQVHEYIFAHPACNRELSYEAWRGVCQALGSHAASIGHQIP